MVYVKKGKFADIGTHEELISKHKSYTKMLSMKDDNEPIDHECQRVFINDSNPTNEEGPLSSSWNTKTNSVQSKHLDCPKLTSLQNPYVELEAFSTEALSSISSFHSLHNITSGYNEKDSVSAENNSDVKFYEGVKYFIKVS